MSALSDLYNNAAPVTYFFGSSTVDSITVRPNYAVNGLAGDDIFSFVDSHGDSQPSVATGGEGDDSYFVDRGASSVFINNSGGGIDTLYLPYAYDFGLGEFLYEGNIVSSFVYDGILLITDLVDHRINISKWQDQDSIIEIFVDANGYSYSYDEIVQVIGVKGTLVSSAEALSLFNFVIQGFSSSDLVRYFDAASTVDEIDVNRLFTVLQPIYEDGLLSSEEVAGAFGVIVREALNSGSLTPIELDAYVNTFSRNAYLSFEDNVKYLQNQPPFLIDDDTNYWNADVNTGLGEVIIAHQAQVYRAYYGALGRLPDQGGYHWWLAEIESGRHTLSSMAAGFIDSIEFRGYADTDIDNVISSDEFISHMYLNVFDRQPDQSGRDWWVAQLDSGNRTQASAFIDMTQSNEYVQLTLIAVAEFDFL